MVASKLHRLANRRGYNPAVNGLLREVNHHLTRRQRHGCHYHYRDHGHYRYHGHYRRKRW